MTIPGYGERSRESLAPLSFFIYFSLFILSLFIYLTGFLCLRLTAKRISARRTSADRTSIFTRTFCWRRRCSASQTSICIQDSSINDRLRHCILLREERRTFAECISAHHISNAQSVRAILARNLEENKRKPTFVVSREYAACLRHAERTRSYSASRGMYRMIVHIFDKLLRAEGVPVHRVLLEYFCNDIRGTGYRGRTPRLYLERYSLNVSDALAISRCVETQRTREEYLFKFSLRFSRILK